MLDNKNLVNCHFRQLVSHFHQVLLSVTKYFSLSAICFGYSQIVYTKYLRNRKHVLRVSVELQKHQWKFGRTRNAVGTRAAGECFHSFFEVSQTFTSFAITRQKHEWKFRRMKNAVGTRAAGECFHSFFEVSQTFMSVSITQQKHRVHVFYFFQKTPRQEKGKQLERLPFEWNFWQLFLGKWNCTFSTNETKQIEPYHLIGIFRCQWAGYISCQQETWWLNFLLSDGLENCLFLEKKATISSFGCCSIHSSSEKPAISIHIFSHDVAQTEARRNPE